MKLLCLDNFRQLDCGPGQWSKLGDYFYLLSTDTATWLGARDKCQNLNGTLAAIKDNSIKDFVYNMVGSKDAYIGGYKIGAKSTAKTGWKWLDGSPWTWGSDNFWARSQVGRWSAQPDADGTKLTIHQGTFPPPQVSDEGPDI